MASGLTKPTVLFVRWRQHTNTMAPGTGGVTAPCVRFGYASANAQNWFIGEQNPNLSTGVIHGGRSPPLEPTPQKLTYRTNVARTSPVALPP